MTNLKDKLSASVRRAKATQQPEAEKPAAEKTVQKTASAKPATVKPTPAKPAPAKPAPKSVPARKPAPEATSANVVQESGSALFPSRVWPD